MTENPIGQTMACQSRDYPEWHKGRRRYSVWLLEILDPAFLSTLEAARERFADILLTPYNRQPHVTVSIGGFLSESGSQADDYSTADRDADLNKLRTARLSPFHIGLGRLDTFSTALHFHILDPDGSIAALRRLLNRGWDEGRSSPYVPHMTVGLYSTVVPMVEIQERIASLPQYPPHYCKISSISLMAYEASVMGGPLERIELMNLATGA